MIIQVCSIPLHLGESSWRIIELESWRWRIRSRSQKACPQSPGEGKQCLCHSGKSTTILQANIVVTHPFAFDRFQDFVRQLQAQGWCRGLPTCTAQILATITRLPSGTNSNTSIRRSSNTNRPSINNMLSFQALLHLPYQLGNWPPLPTRAGASIKLVLQPIVQMFLRYIHRLLSTNSR